jgi:hypothetical protein
LSTVLSWYRHILSECSDGAKAATETKNANIREQEHDLIMSSWNQQGIGLTG